MITPASFRVSARPVIGRGVSPRVITQDPLGTFTPFLAQSLLNHAFVAGLSYVAPATIYVGLFTGEPASLVEVTGGNYSRQPITFSPAIGGVGEPSYVENAAAVEWPVATTEWGIISAAVLLDIAAGVPVANDYLVYGRLLASDGFTPTTKVVQAGDVFLFNVGAFIVGLG